MKKICIIRQPAGLGDILFCQKIGIKIREKFNIPVIWPVIKEYTYLNNYLANNIWFPCIEDNFPYKNIFNTKEVIDNENLLFVPLQDADQILSNKILECKYAIIDLKYNDWKNYIHLRRNLSKEDYLYSNILNLKENEKYGLVLKKYGSLPNFKESQFKYTTKLRIIEMDIFEGISLFDWSKVIENAEEIYTIDTAIILLNEILNLKATKIGYATRRPNDWSQIDYILSKPFERLYE